MVYGFTVAFTTLPALGDMISSFPPVVSQSSFGLAVTNFYHSYLPFSTLGMGWVVPALVGLALGWSATSGGCALRPVPKRSSPHFLHRFTDAAILKR